jgi:hypothetical protein
MEASRRAQSLASDKRNCGFTLQVNSDFPRSDSQIFLRELLFVLCGLCDEIDLQNLG